MIKYDKIYTDNPFIDELVYYTKTIAANAVIKDCDKADENETVDSLKAADLYIACREGRARFDQFGYSVEFINNLAINKVIPTEEADNYEITLKIPTEYRDVVLKAKMQDYINNYEETNNYYRTYMGLPDVEDTDFIYLTKGDVSNIPNLTCLKENYNTLEKDTDIATTIPVHLMNDTDLTILYSHNIIDQLIEENPTKKYLNYMSDNAIDIYKMRKAMQFQILYIPTVANNELMDRWNTKYEQNRMYTLKTYYSEAYKIYSDYYNNFIIVFIVLQTMIDIISEVQEFIARRDIFDDRSIRYLFESYGIPYYPEIPRKYQLAMVKNINTLLKWKASTKNMIDICSLFGFSEVSIFRYYLLRDRRLVPDYDNDNTNDKYQFNYKTIKDENGEEKVVPDNDENYELKFVRVPIEGKADDYLKDKTAYEDYDIITEQDEFWDGKSDHADIKSAILDQEFSYVRTKYISIDTMYDLSEMCFDLPYFINMLVDDTLLEDYLYVKIPVLKNNHQFRVADLFVFMMAATHLYNGFNDQIITSQSKILSILGFNFHVDLHELVQDIYDRYYMRDEDIQLTKNEKDEVISVNIDNNNPVYDELLLQIYNAAKYNIPVSEIMSFDELLQIFTNNKDIWKLASEGMVHADNKRTYEAYKKIYDSCFISEYTTTFFTLQDGTIAETYTDFLKERDYVLYEILQNFKGYTDEVALEKAISDTLIEILYVLDTYMDSSDFKYVFSKFPAVSGDFVRTYMLKVVNFFKSYKVHLLNISTVYKVFDKRENSIKVYEDILKNKTNKTAEDYSTLIEEITGNNDLSKIDKIKLLEEVYFDIERWEFKNLNDKIELLGLIASSINESTNNMTYQDAVVLVDHYKDFPFAEIEYTFNQEDKVYSIESIDPEINNTLKDKYNIFEQIKISYEE